VRHESLRVSLFAPGNLRRMEAATGLLISGVAINGDFLLVSDCTITNQQEIEPVWLVGQGGPRSAIADFSGRRIEGKLSFPLRVTTSGQLEDAAITVITAAQHPDTPVRLDTNHTLVTSYIVAESNAADYNELLSLDTVIFNKLTISATAEKGAAIEANFQGIVQVRAAAAFAVPADGTRGGRQIGFTDCGCSRFSNTLRPAQSYSVEIENKSVFRNLILPAVRDNRDPSQVTPDQGTVEPNWNFMADQSQFLCTGEMKISGSYEEMARLGADRESFVHGGYSWQPSGGVQDNLTLHFGPLRATFVVPIYKATEQPLLPGLVKRTVRFFSQVSPSTSSGSSEILTID
jgi:hypothetical protein